jgi:hypothetical protein
MFKKIFIVLLSFLFYFSFVHPIAFAVENPLTRPNNKMGVHILFDSELNQAAKLVNTSGGDWGYVIIPIQSGDKDMEKWQKFMDTAKKNHVIPILRLATEGDYFNTSVWRKPTHADIIDFANFLESLDWPTKNRYVVVFNEVNRSDEWGGAVNPAEYADLLSFAVTVFKSKSQDFFIINAGLDNAAPRQGTTYMNQYDFIKAMNDAIPGIFNQIDGWSSHSYPNPGFAQPPSGNSTMGIGSFAYEKQLVRSMNSKDLPVFITETGWTTSALTDDRIAQYYQQAWNTVWNDQSIVAITPFVLQANGGAFQQFTLTNIDGSFTKQYLSLKSLPKHQGYPSVVKAKVLAASTSTEGNNKTELKDFTAPPPKPKMFHVTTVFEDVFKWFLGI